MLFVFVTRFKFSTDWELLLFRLQLWNAVLKVLEDDKDFFAEYNCALLVRDDLFERFEEIAPDLEQVLNMLAGQFTNEIMTDLTYEVDVNGATPEEVARDYLLEHDLIEE